MIKNQGDGRKWNIKKQVYILFWCNCVVFLELF